jgi:sugar phosphate isomerase/epimerase
MVKSHQGGTLKGRLPFRLGTTSYVIPADILPNVEFLAAQVDDVELILFESEETSNLPDEGVLAGLRSLAQAHGLTYTVHLPLDARLGAADEGERRRSVGKCLRVMELTRALGPFAWIVHLDGEQQGPVPSLEPALWLARLSQSLEALTDAVPSPRLLCAETLSYPFELVEELVRECGLSACLDVGHVLLAGGDPLASLERYLPEIRVIHLHGVREGRDHVSIGALDCAALRRLLALLGGEGAADRVVTLEVFERPEFEDSVRVLAQEITWPR